MKSFYTTFQDIFSINILEGCHQQRKFIRRIAGVGGAIASIPMRISMGTRMVVGKRMHMNNKHVADVNNAGGSSEDNYDNYWGCLYFKSRKLRISVRGGLYLVKFEGG